MVKKTEKKIVIYSVVIVVMILIFIVVNRNISDDNEGMFWMFGDGNEFVYEIEDIFVENNMLNIRGWFIELKSVRNKEINVESNSKIGVLLYDVNSEIEYDYDGLAKPYKGIKMEVELKKREDVNNYFDCEYDYSNCGFVAKTSISNVDFDNKEYRIIIKTDENNMDALASSTFIRNGKLEFVDKNDLFDIDVKGTDLEGIINEGVCVAACSEYNMLVYQYDHKLYWITDNEYPFWVDDDTYLFCQVDTTQYDKIPNERKTMDQFWVDYTDSFRNFEITESINSGKYRVACRDILSDYAITMILTGNEKWIRIFRPRYNLIK